MEIYHRRIKTVKMTIIILKAIYRFSAIPVKLPKAFFTELEHFFFNICMETQKTPNNQSNLQKKKKKNGAEGTMLPEFRLHKKLTAIKTV